MLCARSAASVTSLKINHTLVLRDAVAGAQEAAVLCRHSVALRPGRSAERLLIENRHLAPPRGVVLGIVSVVEEVALRMLAPNADEVGVLWVDGGEGVIAVGFAEVLVEVEGVNLAQLVSRLNVLK